MAEVTLAGVTKRYGETVAVRGVDLTVADGEFVTLLRPSGCGKTTTLHMVAGLIAPTAGVITLGGRLLAEAARWPLQTPAKRKPGVAFQPSAPWADMPHARVAQ